VKEVEQVVTILPRGIEADDERHRPVAPADAFEALAQLGIADGGLGEGEFLGGRLEIVAEKHGIVAIAGGVDANTDAAGRWRRAGRLWSHRNLATWNGTRDDGAVAARVLRHMSAGAEACDQRSEPQEVTSAGSDAEGSICNERSCLSRPNDLLATPQQ
jgi:hypothetical protein